MKEQEEVPGSRNCSSAKRKRLPENHQEAGDMEMTRVLPSTPTLRPESQNTATSTFSDSVGLQHRHVSQSFLTHMHPFTALGKGLKRGEI